MLAPIGFGAGGAAAGSLAGPGGAAAGAAVGVAVAQSTFPDDSSDPEPIGPVASSLNEAGDLLQKVGYWYLLIFVVVPLLSKRFRTWAKNNMPLPTNFSKKTKKEVDLYKQRLDKLESIVKTTPEGARLLVEEN